MWEDKVTVVSCDMREWNSPENADIVVSELLGSFGDNELSPECLDGIQRFVKRILFYYITNIDNEIFFSYIYSYEFFNTIFYQLMVYVYQLHTRHILLQYNRLNCTMK